MITREEAKQMFKNDVDAYGRPRKIMTKIDIIYDAIEQQVNMWATVLDDRDARIKTMTDRIRQLEENSI